MRSCLKLNSYANFCTPRVVRKMGGIIIRVRTKHTGTASNIGKSLFICAPYA